MPTAAERALLASVRAIPAGEVSATARRAGIPLRALQRIRAGRSNVTLRTLVMLAAALGEHPAVLVGGTAPRRRAAPIGRRDGKPRNVRREQDLGMAFEYEEDLPDCENQQ